MLDSTHQKIAHHQQTIEQFFAEHADEVVAAAGTIADVYRNNGRLLCMGNGGSSCDAGHIAVEFLHPVTAGRPALPAIDLTADQAMMTAVGNDVGFGNIFSRQVIAHGRPGDGLVGISTSGNSENLIKAFHKAKEMGIATIGLAGMNGGKMANHGLDHCLVSHNSVEPGHARLLKEIGQQPLLDFSLRLGEASGAALAAGLVRAAAITHNGMATFESAGISGPGK